MLAQEAFLILEVRRRLATLNTEKPKPYTPHKTSNQRQHIPTTNINDRNRLHEPASTTAAINDTNSTNLHQQHQPSTPTITNIPSHNQPSTPTIPTRPNQQPT
jgi:hypothetical protein